jgi:hypothetical protein
MSDQVCSAPLRLTRASAASQSSLFVSRLELTPFGQVIGLKRDGSVALGGQVPRMP